MNRTSPALLLLSWLFAACSGGGTPDGGGPRGAVDGIPPDLIGVSDGAPEGRTADAGTRALPQIHDDFEGSSLDQTLWHAIDPYGNPPQPATVTLDSSRAYDGRQSVKIQDGFIETSLPAQRFYGRVHAFVAADPGDGHYEAWVAVGPGNQPTEVRYGGHFSILEANYFGNDDEVISDPRGYCAPTCQNGVRLPVQRWTCIEFYFGQDEMRLWLDGIEVQTLHVTSWHNKQAPWSPPYDRVRIGLHNFGGPTPAIWYDAVALDKDRIGC